MVGEFNNIMIERFYKKAFLFFKLIKNCRKKIQNIYKLIIGLGFSISVND